MEKCVIVNMVYIITSITFLFVFNSDSNGTYLISSDLWGVFEVQ